MGRPRDAVLKSSTVGARCLEGTVSTCQLVSGRTAFPSALPERWNVAPLSDAAFRLWVTAAMVFGRELMTETELLALTKSANSGAINELRVWGLLSKWMGRYRLEGPLEWQATARPAIPAAVRRAVIERDGYQCRLCGGEVQPDDLHLDHILPFSRGGTDLVENLQVAHSRCNIRKGNRVVA